MHFSAAISAATLTRKSWRLARSRYKSRLGTRTRTSCSLGRATPSCLFIKMRKSHVYLRRDSTPITQEKLENDATVAGVRERSNRPDRVFTKFRRGVVSLLAVVLAKNKAEANYVYPHTPEWRLSNEHQTRGGTDCVIHCFFKFFVNKF